MTEAIPIYNNERPQWQLGGNTPNETFNSVPFSFNNRTKEFKDQKALRIIKNKENSCKKC